MKNNNKKLTLSQLENVAGGGPEGFSRNFPGSPPCKVIKGKLLDDKMPISSPPFTTRSRSYSEPIPPINPSEYSHDDKKLLGYMKLSSPTVFVPIDESPHPNESYCHIREKYVVPEYKDEEGAEKLMCGGHPLNSDETVNFHFLTPVYIRPQLYDKMRTISELQAWHELVNNRLTKNHEPLRKALGKAISKITQKSLDRKSDELFKKKVTPLIAEQRWEENADDTLTVDPKYPSRAFPRRFIRQG